jgi:hypothetical protein
MPDQYTVIYADHTTGRHFSLRRTPVGTFITGDVTGAHAADILGNIVRDQAAEELLAARS